MRTALHVLPPGPSRAHSPATCRSSQNATFARIRSTHAGPQRAPLLVPALLFLDAIVVARDFGRTETILLAGLGAAACLGRFDRARTVAAFALLAGILAVWAHPEVPPVVAEIERARVAGTVAGEIVAHEWGDSFELEAGDGARLQVSSREHVVAGERLRLEGRLEPLDEMRNPDEPSERERARERGIGGRLTGAHVVTRAPADPGDMRALCARLRDWAAGRLRHQLGEPDATILSGMLFGTRGALARDLRAEFQDTGTVHILVTAGLHLGVVAGVVAFVLEGIGAGRIGASLATIPIVWLYCMVSGAHLPSLRAASMATVALLARASGERTVSLNTLAAAAIVVGTLWPASVGGVSFDLSFSCVGAIVLFAHPISEALQRLRLPAFVREALALSCATQLGVWPLTAAVFLVIAPYAPLANLLVVPVAGFTLVAGLLLLAFSPIPVATHALARLVSWPLAWIEATVHAVASLPFAHVVATPPPGWTIVAYDLLLILAAIVLRPRSE